MRLFEKTLNPGGHDLAEVNQAAANLQGQACTLSARHISDGMLRLQFNREVAYFAQGIVRDVEAGVKSATEGLEEITEEGERLTSQSLDITERVIGLAGGIAQFGLGGGICYGSGGLLCTVGITLMGHGANNMYESGRNLIQNRSDSEGYVRLGYQEIAKLAGGTKREGNLAYLGVDISLSVWGMTRKVVAPKAWKLWRYVKADYVKGYEAASRAALGLEAFVDGFTLKNIFKEWNKDESND